MAKNTNVVVIPANGAWVQVAATSTKEVMVSMSNPRRGSSVILACAAVIGDLGALDPGHVLGEKNPTIRMIFGAPVFGRLAGGTAGATDVIVTIGV